MSNAIALFVMGIACLFLGMEIKESFTAIECEARGEFIASKHLTGNDSKVYECHVKRSQP